MLYSPSSESYNFLIFFSLIEDQELPSEELIEFGKFIPLFLNLNKINLNFKLYFYFR